MSEGAWKTVDVLNEKVDIVIQNVDDEQHLILRTGTKTIKLLEEIAILRLDQKKNWLGILYASVADRNAIYTLVDLEKSLTMSPDSPYRTDERYISDMPGGWRKTSPSTDFDIDFDKEIVTYHEDGRQKSFADYFKSKDLCYIAQKFDN